MKRGQKSQSRVRHQRSAGRYHSPYQRVGTIIRDPFNQFRSHTYDEMLPWIERRMRQQRGGNLVQDPMYPWGVTNPYKYELEPWIRRRIRQQRGGNVYPVIYPWANKGRKRINRRRIQY